LETVDEIVAERLDSVLATNATHKPPPVFDPLAPTVFHQPWWLNAATGGDYAEAVVIQSGKRIGWFPYVVQKMVAGQRLCGMPDMTHFLGPAVDEGRGAPCNQVLRRAQITRELLAQVPKTSGFWQKLHRGTPDALVYQEQGYETTVQFTFEVAPAEPKILWKNMRDKTRNVIRRAREQLTVSPLADLAAFSAFYHANLTASGQRSHYTRALIERMCGAAIERAQGRILSVEDAAGAIQAAIFYVWDAKAAYYLLSSRTRDAHNGAVSLLVWEAMQDIAARGLIFDFEGVATSGSALFFNGFGGAITPRYIISRHTLAHRIAGRLGNPLRRRSGETYV
jgi:hypothetical protein